MDRTDYKILEILQKRGRISMKDLAKEINMSTPATIERVRRLEENGSIVGYRAVIRPDRVGREVLAYLLVAVQYGHREEFYSLVQNCDAVVQASEVAGSFTHLLEISCADMDEFQRLVYRFYDMGNVQTCVVLDHLKKGIYKDTGQDADLECVSGSRGEHSPFRKKWFRE